MNRDQLVAWMASPLSKFKPWVTPDGRSPQRDYIKAAGTHKIRLFRAGNRAGKMLRSDEPVLTPAGWKPIGQLRVGELVFAETGEPTEVVGVYPQGVMPLFRLTFNDGSTVVCGDEHRWKIKDRSGRFHDRSRRSAAGRFGAWRVATLAEIRSRWGLRPKPVNRVTIPVTSPVQFEAKDLPVAPYLFGALLGDGCFVGGVRFTSVDDQIVSRCRSELPAGHRLTPSTRPIDYTLSGEGGRNEVLEAVRALGLYGLHSFEKFVPASYLYASVSQRLDLLRGLMDTDGTCSKRGYVEFSTTSPRLAEDVRFLVQSLGGKSTLRSRVTRFTDRSGDRVEGRRSYRVSCRIPGLNPFHLTRKAERYRQRVRWTYERALVSIEPVEPADATCIEVAHPSHTYLTRDCIVTHNSEVNAFDHSSIAQGFHPYFPKRGATRGWIIGTDWAQGIGTVIWPKIKRYLIPGTYQVSYMRRSAPEIPSAITFANGSEIHFKSAESGPSKFAGADLDWVWIDEEIDAGVVEEARARLLDRGGLLSVSLTPVARMQWVSDLEAEKDKYGNPRSLVVRASMRDAMEAGILNKEAVESFLANLPERQRKVRELGDYAALEGMVYPDFRREKHCLKPRNGGLYDGEGRWCYPWPLPKSWPRYASMDFGFTVPSCVVIAAKDPYSERLIVERVLYATSIRASKWAYEMVSPGGLRLLPTLEEPLITDHDAMERAELAAYGIPTCAAIKDRVPGLEAVERALMPMQPDGRPKLMFVLANDQDPPRNHLTGRDDCHWLVWELERYRYKEKKEKMPDVKDEPVKKDDHAMDALRYLVLFLERGGAGAPPPMPTGLKDKPNPFDGLAPPSPWR